MDTEQYDFLRAWLEKSDINLLNVFLWLGIEPGDWKFLYRFGGRPFRLVYLPLCALWSIGDPIPENYNGLCRITTLNEKMGLAGNYRSLSICEIVKKEKYVADIKSAFSATEVLIVEFVNHGSCH